MTIRAATHSDGEAIWGILEPMLRRGDTYALPRDMTREDALEYWFSPGNETFVWEENGNVLGSPFLRANQGDGGGHVANCGYVSSEPARGRGIGRAMCLHSMKRAAERGFRAMQFNFVVSTNERAVKLWESLRFEIVGRLPGAFQHLHFGYVNPFITYRKLR